jgi:cobalt-zinc-cadmium efflux system protein
MAWALAINLALLAAQVAGGLLTGSLALLADAGHLASDAAAIGIGLLAARLAARPGSARRTFGYQRGEVLAALVNGLALVAVSVLISVAAVNRLSDPPDVAGAGVLALGLAGLAGNLAATAMLARGERADLNLEGVLRHSASDALASLGVIASGIAVLAFGWDKADPIISLGIAALILASSWYLIVEPLNVLMESAPAGTDVDEVGRAMLDVENVRSVHELHVWTVTPGFSALAAHVVIARDADRDLARRRLELLLDERFGLEHTTLQMEEEATDELLRVETPRP